MKLGRRAQIFGGAVSLVVHGALLGYVAWRTSMPDIGFDFQLPSEVEFGLSEAVTLKTWTVMETTLGVTAFALSLLLWVIF